MKPCKDYEDLIPLYIADELSSAEKIAVSQHLEECDVCRGYGSSLTEMISILKSDEVDIPYTYGAELVVALNARLEKRKARQKQLLWAIPAFSSTIAFLVIMTISLFRPETTTNQWLDQFNQEHSYMNFANVGYFGEILLENDELSEEEVALSSAEIFQNAVYQIVEEPLYQELDRYLAATAGLDDTEFQNMINQMKREIL